MMGFAGLKTSCVWQLRTGGPAPASAAVCRCAPEWQAQRSRAKAARRMLLGDGRDPGAVGHLRLAAIEAQLLAARLEVPADQVEHVLVGVERPRRLGRMHRVPA